MQRRVYCVGLRKHVEADIDDIVPITGKRGTKYQCVGKYSENGKDYVVKSWVPKADYEALHGPVVAAAEEFIGADVEAAEPLAADPVADSPVAEDSSEPLEVAPADKSYFLSESVVLSAIKEMAAEDDDIVREHLITHGSNADIYCLSCDMLEGDCPCDEFIEISPETITYDCISCGEEIDEEEGHELVGEFQEKCCLHCFNSAFGADSICDHDGRYTFSIISDPRAAGDTKQVATCGCKATKEFYFDDLQNRNKCDCETTSFDTTKGQVCGKHGVVFTLEDYGDALYNNVIGDGWSATETFEATAQTKKREDRMSEHAALNLIQGAYGFKRIVSGPTYYRFVEGTSSKFLLFAVIERNNGTFQAVNVYGRRGKNFPTLWASDIYPTQMEAERASKAKQKKKARKGYVFLDAEEFRSFMAEHFDDFEGYCSSCDVALNSKTHKKDTSTPSQAAGFGPAFGSLCDSCFDSIALASEQHFNSETLNSSESINNYMSESPLEESPVDEDPLTADPSDLGGPEDFSADATIDLEDGEITIHEKGAKSGGSKKLLLGVILVAGLAAAYQNSDAVLEFFEGLKGDESDPILGCMDETANNYDATATEDDGTCTYDPDDEPTA